MSQPDRKLRVLILSWEYPPVLVGGLGRHVHALARTLIHAGHDVTVATRHGEHPDGSIASMDETVDGVRVVRAPMDPPLFPFTDDTLMQWTLAFNHSLTRAGLFAARTQDFDVIHAHDWLVTHAAVTLKHQLGLPLVATIHSTEAGRHRGWLPNDTSRSIHSVEWWLTYEARQVITCSEHMRWEVNRLFDLPADKVQVIPNGVDSAYFQATHDRVDKVRHQYGEGPVIVSAGRLVYEKGMQDLVDAAAILAVNRPGLQVLIAGDGNESERLRDQIRRRGLTDTVRMLGFVAGDSLVDLLAMADCFAIPSRYEPFGMVALEAQAVGTPVVAGDSGGLTEFVRHNETGLIHTPGEPDALARAIAQVLDDTDLADRLRAAGLDMVEERYTWDPIAERTTTVYRDAEVAERDVEAALAAAELRVVIPEGNLLG